MCHLYLWFCRAQLSESKNLPYYIRVFDPNLLHCGNSTCSCCTNLPKPNKKTCEIVCPVQENNCYQVTSAAVPWEQLCDGRLTKSQRPWYVWEGNDGLMWLLPGTLRVTPRQVHLLLEVLRLQTAPCCVVAVGLLGLISSSHHTETSRLIEMLSCKRLPHSCVFFTLCFFDKKDGLYRW